MPQSTGNYVDVNGINMYYEVFGSGPPLVLIHGGTGTGQFQWKPYISNFSEYFQVFIVSITAVQLYRLYTKFNIKCFCISIKDIFQDTLTFFH